MGAMSSRGWVCRAVLLASLVAAGQGCNFGEELKRVETGMMTGIAHDPEQSEWIGVAMPLALSWSPEGDETIVLQLGFGGALTGDGEEAAASFGVLLYVGEESKNAIGGGLMHWTNANGDPVTGPYLVLAF